MADTTPPHEGPSIKRLAAAHAAGIGVMLLIFPITTYVLLYYSFSYLESILPGNPDLFLPAIASVLFILGVGNALMEIPILKRWITNQAKWVLCSGLLTVALMWTMFKVWEMFVLSTRGEWVSRVSLYYVIEDLGILPIILIAIPIGYFGGLVIGAVQARWLNGGKLRCAIFSGIAWSLIFSAAVFLDYMFLMSLD